MRVISGKYKGRRLTAFKASHIRPTTDQTKESIFNSLRPYLAQAHVVDLYAGTGSLGIEALSQGAQHVCFVESSRQSLRILKKNLDLLKVPIDNYKIYPQDVFLFLKKNERPFDIILIDPPFTEKLAHKTLSALAKGRSLAAQSLVVIESGPGEKVEEVYGPLSLFRQRDFGDKKVSFFKKKE
ncbi:MAG: 16S rRNA (guanine(966)-N(2))-methyltransferase RsmD [Bdellovibrio sp.]|nr:MAG: 16S rRNA (guanine(966)-N(2))-methyltransferase RsmD [Bdellovibrio sp.]